MGYWFILNQFQRHHSSIFRKYGVCSFWGFCAVEHACKHSLKWQKYLDACLRLSENHSNSVHRKPGRMGIMFISDQRHRRTSIKHNRTTRLCHQYYRLKTFTPCWYWAYLATFRNKNSLIKRAKMTTCYRTFFANALIDTYSWVRGLRLLSQL